MVFLIALLGIFLTAAYLWSSLIAVSLGILIIVVCLGYALANPSLDRASLTVVGIIIVTIVLLPSTEEKPVYVKDDSSAYNYPSAYEEDQERLRGTCSYAQESSSDNLYCDAGD